MPRALLDFRVRTGGAGRYGRELTGAMSAFAGRWDVAVFGGSPRLRHAPFSPWGRWALSWRAQQWRADLVHGLHDEAPVALAAPTVVTVPDLIPLDHPASMPSALRRRLFAATVRASVTRADRVVVPSPATAEALARHGFVAGGDKVVVVPYGVAPVFRPASPDEEAAARRRFAGGRRYVGALWHPRAHKNLAAFVAAAGLLPAHRDVAWAVAGTDQAPLAVAAVPSLPDDDLRLFYAGADVVVVPSLFEGFGFPVVEALACGTAVVAGDGVGALAYVEVGVQPVDVSDAAAVAEAVGLLLDDDGLRSRLAAAGLAAARRLTVDEMVRRTVTCYAAVLDEAGSGTSRTRSRGRRRSSPAP